MSEIEFYVSVSAVLCFAVLFYRLAIIMGSLPIRLRTLAKVTTVLNDFREHGQSMSSKDVGAIAKQDQNANRIMAKVIDLRRKGQHDAADRELGVWAEQLEMGYTRHYQLADLATSVGMLYTVAGGMLAFQNIGGSDDPFAAFPSLAIAMATTLVALLISIPVKEALNAFGARVDKITLAAYQISLDRSEGSDSLREQTSDRGAHCSGSLREPTMNRGAVHDDESNPPVPPKSMRPAKKQRFREVACDRKSASPSPAKGQATPSPWGIDDV